MALCIAITSHDLGVHGQPSRAARSTVVQKTVKTERQAIRDYAANLKPGGNSFSGILGNWSFDATGEVSFALYKVQIKNGAKVILAR